MISLVLWWIYARKKRILCDIYSLQPGLLLSLSLPLRMGLLVLTISPGSIPFHSFYTLHCFGSTDDFNFILWIIFFLDLFKSLICPKFLSKKKAVNYYYFIPSSFHFHGRPCTQISLSFSCLFV